MTISPRPRSKAIHRASLQSRLDGILYITALTLLATYLMFGMG